MEPKNKFAGLCCPLCGGALTPAPAALRCPAGHSFDLAREGYVHLLPVQRKRTKAPGDSAQMVEARHAFLAAGHYAPLQQALAELCLRYAPQGCHLLDAGCGEGCYDQAVWAALEQAGRQPSLLGFDIAKPAVRLAARGLPQAGFCVAGSFAAPVQDGWADLLLNIFSPFAREEFLRVLRPGGHLIYAVPGPDHLLGLKRVLYDTPYPNPVQTVAYPGFVPVETLDAQAELVLEGPEIRQLFAMTPYYWRTPPAGAARLAACAQLCTPIHFRFLVFRRG